MAKTVSVEFLRTVGLFSSLGEDDLEKLSGISKIYNFKKDKILFYEKDDIDKMFFLVKGSLKFYKVDRFDNEIFLYKISSGSLVYDISKFTTSNIVTCFANAEFDEDSEILAIEAESFKKEFFHNEQIMQKFLEESFKAIAQLQCIINRDIVFDGMAKVAHMISNDIETFNSLKKHEIAYMLHIQPETLSRILKKLNRNGIISIEKNSVTILNEEELRNIYE